ARVELGLVLGHEAADGAGRGQAQVGVDVHLAHAVLDAFDDFFHRHAVGFADFTAEFVDDFQPFLRHGRRAVHDQVGIGNAGVNGLDAVDGQNVAGGRARELVGA